MLWSPPNQVAAVIDIDWRFDRGITFDGVAIPAMVVTVFAGTREGAGDGSPHRLCYWHPEQSIALVRMIPSLQVDDTTRSGEGRNCGVEHVGKGECVLLEGEDVAIHVTQVRLAIHECVKCKCHVHSHPKQLPIRGSSFNSVHLLNSNGVSLVHSLHCIPPFLRYTIHYHLAS